MLPIKRSYAPVCRDAPDQRSPHRPFAGRHTVGFLRTALAALEWFQPTHPRRQKKLAHTEPARVESRDMHATYRCAVQDVRGCKKP